MKVVATTSAVIRKQRSHTRKASLKIALLTAPSLSVKCHPLCACTLAHIFSLFSLDTVTIHSCSDPTLKTNQLKDDHTCTTHYRHK